MAIAASLGMDLSSCGSAASSGAQSAPPAVVVVTISPQAANVFLGATQKFQASVTGASDTAISWEVNGQAGGDSSTGTISADGTYTAPPLLPADATVTITAMSVASQGASASATVTLGDDIVVAISPQSANVPVSGAQQLSATITASGNPSRAVAWSVNGVTGGNATYGTITADGAGSSATYTAPSNVPTPAAVTVAATSTADATKTASATLTITATPAIAVSITPAAASVAIGQRTSFSATVTGTANQAVSWLVDGVANGNATLGQVCVTGSNPCASPTGPAPGTIDFLAPVAVPATNPVTLTAVSAADTTKSASASVTITGPPPSIAVSVSPAYAFLAPSGPNATTARFSVRVTGTGNTAVNWTLASGVAGQGCSGAACGTISPAGLYTSPSTAPSPNTIAVTATSAADPTKSATALVSITNGPSIEAVLPSSVTAGAVEGFPLSVDGAGFAAGSGSGASVILFNGAPRTTTCQSATSCSIALAPDDVAIAGTATLQVQNPGTPGALSNPVAFVVVPFNATPQTISLTAGTPVSPDLNFVVTEPTTAAESSPINVDAVGPLANQNCTLGAAPIIIQRPSSGSSAVSLCIHGNGLDPSFTYAFTGPGGGDIPATASAVTGLFPNTIELDLQVSISTASGLRTLVITTINNDRAFATGVLEVQ
ncbi:MAG TPA: hypothetical protein VMU43_06635 [Candidatus Acidoferrum sp.]|nr:hypothetical protein [Candidatus Acidoferrum sp.]